MYRLFHLYEIHHLQTTSIVYGLDIQPQVDINGWYDSTENVINFFKNNIDIWNNLKKDWSKPDNILIYGNKTIMVLLLNKNNNVQFKKVKHLSYNLTPKQYDTYCKTYTEISICVKLFTQVIDEIDIINKSTR